MNPTIQYALALAIQLLFAHSSQASDSRDQITTSRSGETCLRTFNGDDAYQICDGSALSPQEKATLDAAIKAKEAGRLALIPKPDPRTPQFNKCVVQFHEDYGPVSRECALKLNDDLDAAFGSFWHQDARKALYQETMKRVQEMRLVSEEKARKMEQEKMDRRRGMTPSDRLIDELREKITAPCRYYDQNYVSQSCD